MKILIEIPLQIIGFILTVLLYVGLIQIVQNPSIKDSAGISLIFLSIPIVHFSIWMKGQIGVLAKTLAAGLALLIGVILITGITILFEYFISSWLGEYSLSLSIVLLLLLQVGAAWKSVDVFRSTLFKMETQMEADRKIEIEQFITGKCDSCGTTYRNIDYRTDVDRWICSVCHNEIPKLMGKEMR